MKVSVDPDGCMGHGMCQAMAPEVYEISQSSGMNEMGVFDLDPARRDMALRGALACPERAILVEDAD
ncbi:ferredoxin [Dactylosporangium sp. NBC_01737]|uniref:ferredoxin n=1 Tax=Dactylosporangium sp. NBC_01737 TaxID=2975959 RepID=UPI002E113639|nr:ferredoxin [Dactylosporangium sp. NBC_01737]